MWSNLILILSQLVLLTASALGRKTKNIFHARLTHTDKTFRADLPDQTDGCHQRVEGLILISSASALVDDMKLQVTVCTHWAGTLSNTGAFIPLDAVALDFTSSYLI